MQAHVVMDTQDPERITDFWSKLLELPVTANLRDGQYVILGAGLDSFAWRRPDAALDVLRLGHT